MRYTLDSMLPEQAFRKLGKHLQTLEGGSQPSPTPTNTTVQNTNIPEYAQPYVENMLGAAQSQMYNQNADGTLGSLQAYKPYSTNPSDYVAGFSPMQNQAMQGTAGLQTPGQFGQASGLAGASGLGSLSMAGQLANTGNQYNQMATNPDATQAFMNPYIQSSLDPQLAEIRRQYGITGTQEQGQATQAGAMGGSREALMASENQRNMGTAQNQAIAQGYNNAFQAAQQAQQFGANLGLQGGQAALQGLGQASTAAGQLGQLGTAQLGAQQNILGAQNTMGQQQQTQQQNIMNQGIQNYATAQQYPLMELGTMSNLLRGLPMQATTTQQYQATPSALTTGLGTMGALGSLAMAAPKAEGGVIKSYAKGGIASYDVGGAIKTDIARMSNEELQKTAQTSQSATIRGEAKAELSNRAQGELPELAGGGIIAFKEPTKENNQSLVTDPEGSKTKADYGSFLGDVGAVADKLNPTIELADEVKNIAGRVGRGAGVVNQGMLGAARLTKEGLDALLSHGGYEAPVPVAKPAAAATGIEQAAPDAAATPQYTKEQQAADTATAQALLGSPQGAIPTIDGGKVPQYKSTTEAEVNAASPWAQKILEKGVPEGQKEQTQDEYIKEKMDFVAKSSTNPDTQKIIDQYKDKIDGAKTAADQNFWLHASAGFAKMATLTGPTLAAAMSALGDEIPKYVTDKNMQEKLLTENQRAMYEITQAELARKNNDYVAFKVHNDNAKKIALEGFYKAAEEHDRTEKMIRDERKTKYEGEVNMYGHKLSAATQLATTQMSVNKPTELAQKAQIYATNPVLADKMFGTSSKEEALALKQYSANLVNATAMFKLSMPDDPEGAIAQAQAAAANGLSPQYKKLLGIADVPVDKKSSKIGAPVNKGSTGSYGF